jgi:predicted ATP-binding protein involved in virulence
MRITKLHIKNIGPFIDEQIVFIQEDQLLFDAPVTIITGENGAGKSIILDAIRYLLMGGWNLGNRERTIVSNKRDFLVQMEIVVPNNNTHEIHILESTKLESDEMSFKPNAAGERVARHMYYEFSMDPLWIFDFWTSKLSNDSFKLSTLPLPEVKNFLKGSLIGIHENNKVSQWICYFDYLRSGDSEYERELGETMFKAIKHIFQVAVANGELSHVSRLKLEPIIRLRGKDLTLDKLSSGNMYILQRLISILSKAFSVIILNRENPVYESVFEVPGVLLIDEAENHLHPKWQKSLISSIRKLFPKIQIIVTTHSPFIVSSVEANIYVCKSGEKGAYIANETDVYSNKPVDEILTTELFNTQPFNLEISKLIEERQFAAEAGDETLKKTAEEKLKALNPQYFSYFDLDEKLKALYKQ